MSDEIDLSIRQFTEAWRLMCTRHPQHAVAADDGIEYVFSNVPIAFFNVAFVTGRRVSADTLAALGTRARAWAARQGVPWMLVVTHERLAGGTDAAAALGASDLAPAIPLTGMLARHVAPVTSIRDGLQLVVPQDDAGCAALLEINGAAYAMDLTAAADLVGRSSFWREHVPVVGLLEGRAVACATVLIVDGYRYVAMVATDPAHQRRGHGEAAMRHALDIAARRHGELPTFLHATDAGRPLYERMGYRPVSTHTAFMERRFLEGH
jgi:ribosomal protein S18 acetylase RimI-like enzyme